MIITCLDLELNQPSNTIIQVGVVAGNIKTGQVVDMFEKNIFSLEEINPEITKLTGITQNCVNSGEDIYRILGKIVGLNSANKSQRALWTWGGGDTYLLMKQTSLVKWPFAKRFTDIKTLYYFYAMRHGLKIKGGLKASMDQLGLTFDGTQHRAGADALNTFKVASCLFNRWS